VLEKKLLMIYSSFCHVAGNTVAISMSILVKEIKCPFIYLWLYSPLLDLDRFASFLIGRTPWNGDQPVAMPLPNTNIK
jgi:hypothetical protein